KHVLYQTSVQAPETEIDFMVEAYRARSRKKPLSMREDFCGTAILCATWIKSRSDRIATGVDLDPDVLAWGIENNLKPLKEPGTRVRLLQQDVLKKSPGKYDVINAMNFSYWVFKTRELMKAYFKAVRGALEPNGIFVCD